MPGSAATRSAGRLHPRNRAPLRRVFYVLLFVVALLGGSAVIYGTPWAASASKPQCNNRIDDDGDGKIDYPTDPGCTGRGDKSEVDPVAPPPPPPPPPGLTLQQIDGGLDYYAQFTNPLPTSPSFFPIGVWGSYAHEPDNMDKDAAVGINTYVWAADVGYLEAIRNDGRFHVIVNRSDGQPGSETFARLLDDEMDMQQGPDACPDAIDAIKATLPPDGRARYANYGKGVLSWGASGYGGHNDTSSACFVNAQDITSADEYWHTDIFQTEDAMSQNSWGYGWNIERQRMLDATDGVRTPQWGFVEVTDLGEPQLTISPAEIRASVWHMLIKGARGIIYFQHDFGGTCLTHHALRETGSSCYGAKIAVVTSTNAQIKSLAPVLNSPFVNGGRTVTGPVEHMIKWDGINLYVFAAGRSNGSMDFSMPCVGNATTVVLGESRSISIADGEFSDTFADGNAVHIYRIDGGSTCGL
jgi:hypothetical protein